MNNIRLTAPVQMDIDNPAVELNPGNLKRWLNALPVNDVSDTIEKLDESISAFNEVKVAPANRLKLLEIYYNAFHSILHGYDEMRIAQLKVSASQKRQVSEKILWLYIKLSHGYKIIVKDYAVNPEPAKPPPHLLLSVFRALELTMISQICGYRFRLEIPPFTFLDQHQLYAFAEHYGLTDKPVKAASGYSKTPTIASYYALSMIFINLNPAEYEAYTIELLFFALQPFAFRCSITHDHNFHENAYVFRINLNEMQCPSLVISSEMYIVNESTRYLNIDNFVIEVQNWLSTNESKKDNLLIEQELELLHSVITRMQENLNACKDQFAESSTEQVENEGVKLVFGLGPLEGLLIAKSVNVGLCLNYNMSEWTVQSQSETGCELVSHLDKVDDEISLGDLAAMVSGGSGEPVDLIKIAYICRLQQLEQGVLLTDLEYLNGNAYPMTYKLASDEEKKISATPATGIYLVNGKAGEEETVMVVNRKHYHEDQQYLIKTREKVCTVEATHLIRQTLRFAFFRCRIVKEETGNSQNDEIANIAV